MPVNPIIKANAADYGVVEYYDHFDNIKGQALIINNCNFKNEKENRPGSQVDVENMNALLQSLGYEVSISQNLTGQQIIDRVKTFAASLQDTKYQSCAVVIMTHGHLKKFSGIDGQDIKERDIIRPIASCKWLLKKPKLFFFQACREGDKENESESESETETENYPPVPAARDTFVFHSTAPGCVSYRNELYGAWFIQTVCRIVGYCAHDSWANVDQLNTLICHELKSIGNVRGWTQEPDLPKPNRSTGNLSKKFHFFPVETVYT